MAALDAAQKKRVLQVLAGRLRVLGARLAYDRVGLRVSGRKGRVDRRQSEAGRRVVYPEKRVSRFRFSKFDTSFGRICVESGDKNVLIWSLYLNGHDDVRRQILTPREQTVGHDLGLELHHLMVLEIALSSGARGTAGGSTAVRHRSWGAWRVGARGSAHLLSKQMKNIIRQSVKFDSLNTPTYSSWFGGAVSRGCIWDRFAFLAPPFD